MLYFLSWELSSVTNDFDLTRGDEVIEIDIHDVGGCRPAGRFVIPLVQPGQPFVGLRLHMVYQKDRCSKPLKDIFVQIRIIRGLDRKLIYTSELYLSASEYIDGKLRRIPIYRTWHWEDFLRVWMALSLTPFAKRFQRYKGPLF